MNVEAPASPATVASLVAEFLVENGVTRVFGIRVSDSDELDGALRKALESAPAVVHVDVTRDAVSPDAGKGLGFVPEYQALTPWDDREIARRTQTPTQT